MVTLVLGNLECQIVGLTDKHILKKIDDRCSYQVPTATFMLNRTNNWDGKYRLLKKNLCFPAGLKYMVEDILRKNNIKYQIEDKRTPISYGKPIVRRADSPFKERDYQIDTVNKCFAEGSGIIRMATGCHRIGQKILMFDGTVKNVEDIKIGDQVMGPDSRPRNVLELCRGVDKMVKIIPTKGEAFVVNENHILSLKRTNVGKSKKASRLDGSIIDISVKEWYNLGKHNKHILKLFRTQINFEKKNLSIDPYFLGLLLGDGSIKKSISITNIDKEIIQEIHKAAKDWNLDARKCKITYYLVSKEKDPKKMKGTNKLKNELNKLGLLGTSSYDKFIPLEYKTSSREDRLQILAGLMDTDGYYGHTFDYISKSKQLAEDVAFIARSLGLSAYIKECIKSCQTGYSGKYYRVSISGNIEIIPTKLKRKQATPRKQKKNVLVTGFKTEALPEEEYYGFKVDADNRYVMGDFTVTHNSGKSLTLCSLVAKYNVPTVIYVIGTDLLYQMKETMEQAFNVECGIVGDGNCDIKKITVATIWSAASAFDIKIKYDEKELQYDTKKIKERDRIKIINMVRDASLIVMDECQFASSFTFQFLNRESKSAVHKFLFSGTPWRENGDELLLDAVGGKRIVDIDASYLIKRGFLVRPNIYFAKVPPKRGVGKTYSEVYNNYIVNNTQRNEMVVKAAKKLVKDGRKPLILINSVAHGKLLEKMFEGDLRVFSLDGKNSTADRQDRIKMMKSGEADILIASRIFNQGIDIPELDALILACGGKSKNVTLQRIGRVIRTGPKSKKDAIVLDFLDQCKYLRDHSQIRHRVYLTEPEFKVKVLE